MSHQDLQEDLPRLLKHYKAQTPAVPFLIPSPPWPNRETAAAADAHRFFAQHFTESAQETSVWKQQFWRRLIKDIESACQALDEVRNSLLQPSRRPIS